MDVSQKVWANAIDMLYARGYTRENIRKIFFPMYTAVIATHDDDSGPNATETRLSRKVLMVMDPNEKVGIDTVRRIIHELQTDIQTAILIIRNKITPFAQQAIDTLRHHTDGYIEVFTFQELHINICKHKYVPTHRILSAKEKADVSARFSATDPVFPKLILTDPLVRYYGLSRGDMVQFVRKMGYETRLVYRVVS